MSSMATIQDFLAQKRIAVVGVSHDPKNFSRGLFRTLRERGYDAIAVNPGAGSIDDAPCFASLGDISPPVDGVLVMTSPSVTDEIVRQCAHLGIPRVWMYRAAGDGALSPQAVEFCEEHGIKVVPGECPYMFFAHGGWIHSLHGFVKRISGGYPA
ncbi:MAG TPA: CoA-binding protein [Terriglobales bacterium]